MFDWWKKMKGAKSQTMCRFYAHWQNEGNGTFQQLQHRNSGLPYFLFVQTNSKFHRSHTPPRDMANVILLEKSCKICFKQAAGKNYITPEIVNNHIIISSSLNSNENTLVSFWVFVLGGSRKSVQC